MKSLLRVLKLDFLPAAPDFALLVLRVWIGLSMLMLHGWGKLVGFSGLVEKMQPLIINPTITAALAVLGEAIASVFLVAGLFSRFAALGGIITMGTAFFVVHGGKLTGQGNGELSFLYLAAYVVLFLAGPGRYSIDRKIG